MTYKSAWFLCHRIREAMDDAENHGPLGGAANKCQADETYYGNTRSARSTTKGPLA